MAKKQTALFNAENKRPVALLGVKFDVEVKDICSKVLMRQHFRNKEKCAIEAVYCFPIEHNAAIYDLKIKTGGEEISASAREREKAFELYDRMLEKGGGSFLLDMGEKDMLLVSVGNLLPGEDVSIEIGYITQLSICDGITRLQVPATLTPRYKPMNADPVKTGLLSPPYASAVPYGFSINVNVMNAEISGISSISHKIRMKPNSSGQGVLIELNEKNACMDRDFILDIKSSVMDQPLCIVSRHENGEAAAIIRLFPEFRDEGLMYSGKSSDMLFILDCSGSMACSSIENAKETLEICLRAMKEGDFFNIIRFGTDYQVFYPEALPYNENNLRRALKDIAGIEADMGGTELSEVLSLACSMPVHPESRRDVILLTDGAVHNTSELVKYVAEFHKDARFYTFGIGYAASHNLVKGIARASGGAWEMLQPGEKIQQKVLRQFARILQDHIKITDIKAENADITVDMEHLPAIYEGDSFTAFAKVKKISEGATLLISGKSGKQNFRWKCGMKNIGDDNLIPSLWALDTISSLEYKGYSSQKGKNTGMIRKIALKFGLLSCESSLVAVSSAGKNKGTDAFPEYRRVPVMISAGYEAYETNSASLFLSEEISEYSTSDEWYLRLLKTQDAEGAFDGLEAIASRLKRNISEMEKAITELASKSEWNDRATVRKIIITSLALRLLASEREIERICGRAIRKAGQWLDKALAPDRTERLLADELVDTLLSYSSPQCSTRKAKSTE
ncbi:MAG: hypothetical protein A2017_17435 [Lentisphaerae bacterium GWF2_44_16]|nr:MAG: hypothetical protein A2017_17435 [Lentisphaerae bacterium GWF2_44_16]